MEAGSGLSCNNVTEIENTQTPSVRQLEPHSAHDSPRGTRAAEVKVSLEIKKGGLSLQRFLMVKTLESITCSVARAGHIGYDTPIGLSATKSQMLYFFKIFNDMEKR